MMGLWDAAKEIIKKWILTVSVTSYLGPGNIWLGNSIGLAWQCDGYTLIGYVVVRTRVDLRGHCGRSRSMNTAVWLATSIITDLKQLKLMINHNLACLSLHAPEQNDPFIKA